jgi:hypothetical protein
MRFSGLENIEYSCRDVTLTTDTLYPQKLAPTSPRSAGRLVCIVRSRTQAREFVFFVNRIPLY